MSSIAEVFVSYASADRARVLEIADELKRAGVSVWLDRERIEGGTSYGGEIVRGISGCKVVLLVVSDASMRSWAVKQEIILACERQKTLVPLILRATSYPEQVEFFLAGRQYIGIEDRPTTAWLPELLRALEHAGVGRMQAGPTTTLRWSFEDLRRLGRLTDQLWPALANVPSPVGTKNPTRGLGAPQANVSHGYRLGSWMRLMLESDRDGHVLLLDEGPEGTLYCLCPSAFAPSTRVHVGLNVYPQPGGEFEAFQLTGVPGREELLAIVTEQPLPLDWRPLNSRTPARVLGENDAVHLLDLLKELPAGSWTALATYFDVVA